MSNIIDPKKHLNKALLKQKVSLNAFDNFFTSLDKQWNKFDVKQNEEYHKYLIRDFFIENNYGNKYFINISDRCDLAIRNDKNPSSSIAVIFEVKSPSNTAEMVTTKNINKKAFQELVLNFVKERIINNNLEIKNLIITNFYEWFIFDAIEFEKYFVDNKIFKKSCESYFNNQTSGHTTEFFYQNIALPYIEEIKNEIKFIYFDLRQYLNTTNKNNQSGLILLYKLFSPEYLLKLPFINDSNTLNKDFYSELLYIIGLKEVKVSEKKLIQRLSEKERENGSLIENTISQIKALNKLGKIDDIKKFGSTEDEQSFNIALELIITWINRILFLKLLEAQLINYNNDEICFLNIQNIPNYNVLNDLFFKVLAVNKKDREYNNNEILEKLPYLNSSLFEPTDLEKECLVISNLSPKDISLFSKTILKNSKGKKQHGQINTLDYLFRFLDSYDFSSETKGDLQEENKTLISASVLGLIFEKINGYKDGSYFTPGYITMYMCRETISKAVVNKFNEIKKCECRSITDVYNKIGTNTKNIIEANNIINSIKICDPAVGSGHFLVSALNEIIAIKSKLKILVDKNNRVLRDYEFEIVNDELIITSQDGEIYYYQPCGRYTENQRVQETLFHEKQTIIENCLFGVDINPNSVKICRLRLWIELLKNSYYTESSNYRELETLPNIDINIKCGNSLISKLNLSLDINDQLKKSSKLVVNDYYSSVMSYKNTYNRHEKNKIEQNIIRIKESFKQIITQSDPLLLKITHLKDEIELLERDKTIFGLSEKECNTRQERILSLKNQLILKEKQFTEYQSNNIYKNAFEWRIEFPELLDKDGNFIGFDVVIGNPPYGVKLIDIEKDYLKNRFTATSGEVEIYTFFIELAMSILLKQNGLFSFITTNTIYYLDKFSEIRKNSFLSNKVISLLELEKQVFADAPDIVPAIYVLQKNSQKDNIIKLYKSSETKRIYDLVEFEGFKVNGIEQNKFETKTDFVFSLSPNEAKENLLKRISQLDTVKKSYKVVYGIKTGDNDRFLSREITGTENWKKCASSAKNIKKYTIDWQGDYLNVCNDLSGLNNINYEQPKILIQYIRKLSMPIRLVCALDLNGEYYPLNNFSFVVSENGNSLKVLLGILNSRLMNWYFSNCFVDYNIKPKYIEQLPLPAKIISSDLEKKVTEILYLKAKDKEIDTSILENQIDQIVYKLYDLIAEEIQIIEQSQVKNTK